MLPPLSAMVLFCGLESKKEIGSQSMNSKGVWSEEESLSKLIEFLDFNFWRKDIVFAFNKRTCKEIPPAYCQLCSTQFYVLPSFLIKIFQQ
jgi:hypothetical protein